jgi:tRNA(Ile)-lysidine synthase
LLALGPDSFFGELNRAFPGAKLLIAFSGGLDSTVLLHLCARGAGPDHRKRLVAVHVDHGLHPRSGEWAEHCVKTSDGFEVDCRVLTPEWSAGPGQSLEEAARTARYEAMLQLVTKGTVVLTAQHRDDQAETILLQLFRGSGLRGLSGMPESIAFGEGILHRPLLRFSRRLIRSYADSRALQWIDDPSNADTHLDRNYLRREIIPRIRERWPGMEKTLARSARHCAEAQSLIDPEVDTWMRSLVDPVRNTILIPKFIEFDEARQRSILRHWIRDAGFRSPSEVKLRRILTEVIAASPDRFPRIQWGGAEIRRYRDELHLFGSLQDFDRDQVIQWPIRSPLVIRDLGGRLECRSAAECSAGLVDRVSVRFRQGGESCRLPGRQGTRTLKNIFQELAIPPWERDRIPLIYIDGELAAIGDLVVCEPFHRLGLEFRWIRS